MVEAEDIVRAASFLDLSEMNVHVYGAPGEDPETSIRAMADFGVEVSIMQSEIGFNRMV